MRNIKTGLKKKIFLTWLALELAAIPFAVPTFAKIQHAIPAVDTTRIVYVNIPAPDGISHFLVASDARFVIIAENTIGDIETNITQKGNIAGTNFGALTQNIIVRNTCSQTISTSAHIVYSAAHRTAENKGAITDQAVLVEMRYDPKLTPKFTFKTQSQISGENLSPTAPCTA